LRKRITQTRLLIACISALSSCVDPAEQAQREREGARLAIAADAAFYWQCNHKAVIQAGECRRWREAYERDRAAFLAKYGEPNSPDEK